MPSTVPSAQKDIRHSLALRYHKALKAQLAQAGAESMRKATELGRSAQLGGLATLDLAIIHEQAVLALARRFDFTTRNNAALRDAGRFFTRALVPLHREQNASREASRTLIAGNRALRQQAVALARANRRLEREIARRKASMGLIHETKERYRLLFLKSQIMEKKLRSLTHQIISAQEEERREISRELHDDVVQTLVGINVELSALGKGASVGLRALKSKIASTQRLVTNSVNAVHRFARELRPAVLDALGLIPALNAYSKNLAVRKNLKIRFSAYAGVEALDSAKRTVLFRVAQEALTNVARHAHATQVVIKIRAIKGGAIRLEVADNGKSFAVEKVQIARTRGRLGLLGMRERVEMVGGRLTLLSIKGKGTTVRAEIPFTPTDKIP